MGHKVNPLGFRLGNLYTWQSRWFADDRRYKDILIEDVKIRKALFGKLKNAGLSKVEIERSINKLSITLHVSRPGVVIGRGGSGQEELKKFLNQFVNKLQTSGDKKGKQVKIDLHVEPVKEPNLDAYLVATTISDQIARRIPHKRAVNQALEKVISAGAKGVKIRLSGRIAGAEIGRVEMYTKGSVPLSTIRENIEYAQVPSLTKSGYVGIKVWISKK